MDDDTIMRSVGLAFIFGVALIACWAAVGFFIGVAIRAAQWVLGL